VHDSPFSQTVKMTPNLLTIDPSLKMNTPIHVLLSKDSGSTSRFAKRAVYVSLKSIRSLSVHKFLMSALGHSPFELFSIFFDLI